MGIEPPGFDSYPDGGAPAYVCIGISSPLFSEGPLEMPL